MGIKNYQGKLEKQPKSLFEDIKVSDYMSRDMVVFHPEQTIPEVIDILISNRISGGPVVNMRDELVGIISEGDCIKQIAHGQYYNMPIESVKVEECMITEVETIDGNMSVFEAANKFLNARRRRFPIVEGKKLVGMISQKDILIAAMKLNSQTWDRNR